MLEVHAILHRQRCYENMTEKTGTLSDAYSSSIASVNSDAETLRCEYSDNNRKNLCSNKLFIMGIIERSPTNVVELPFLISYLFTN